VVWEGQYEQHQLYRVCVCQGCRAQAGCLHHGAPICVSKQADELRMVFEERPRSVEWKTARA
jgi:hypothetical protein